MCGAKPSSAGAAGSAWRRSTGGALHAIEGSCSAMFVVASSPPLASWLCSLLLPTLHCGCNNCCCKQAQLGHEKSGAIPKKSAAVLNRQEMRAGACPAHSQALLCTLVHLPACLQPCTTSNWSGRSTLPKARHARPAPPVPQGRAVGQGHQEAKFAAGRKQLPLVELGQTRPRGVQAAAAAAPSEAACHTGFPVTSLSLWPGCEQACKPVTSL